MKLSRLMLVGQVSLVALLATTLDGPAIAALAPGDIDCDGDVDAVDALKIQRHVAGLSVSQEPGCPIIGSPVASIFGDVDCDGDVDSVDGLKILRQVAGLSLSQGPSCPDSGGPGAEIVETIEAPALLPPDEFAASSQNLADLVAALNQAELAFIEDATAVNALAAAAPGDMAMPKASVGTSLLASDGEIAFHSTRDGNWEIYVMDADGANQTNLTNSSADEFEPAWSPDGSALAFVSTRDGNFEIYVMKADGADQARLTSHPASDRAPAWSPDGARIAFVSSRDGNAEIYAMNLDGTGLARLTNSDADDLEPAWSPDGTEIAFHSKRDGNSEIYVMGSDGSSPVNLTGNPAADELPSWSPDGKIGFQSNRTGNYEIYVMDRDGSSPTNLTNNLANDWTPAWSPDGTRMAFNSDRDGNSEIYAMSANGAEQTRLTNEPQVDAWPRWSPAPMVTPTPTPALLDDDLREVAARATAVAQAAEVLGLTMALQDDGSEEALQQADMYYGVARLGYALVIEAQNGRDGLASASLTPSAAAEAIAEYGARLWNPSVTDPATSGNPFLSQVSDPLAIPEVQFLTGGQVADLQTELPAAAQIEGWLAVSEDRVTKLLAVSTPAASLGNPFDPSLLEVLTTLAGQADGDAARQVAVARLLLQTGPEAQAAPDDVYIELEVRLFRGAAIVGAEEIAAGRLPAFAGGSGSLLTREPASPQALVVESASVEPFPSFWSRLLSFIRGPQPVPEVRVSRELALFPVEDPDVSIEILDAGANVCADPDCDRWEVNVTVEVKISGDPPFNPIGVGCFGTSGTASPEVSNFRSPGPFGGFATVQLRLPAGRAAISCSAYETQDDGRPGRVLAESESWVITIAQEDARCPDDSDCDFVFDRDDQCPSQPEDRDLFQDSDGCPDPDNDGDGILDGPDGCDNQPEDFDGFQDFDGCDDPDNDSDGVLDVDEALGCRDNPDCDADGVGDGADQCPGTPIGTTVDGIGCPLPVVVSLGFQENVTGGQVNGFSSTATLTANFGTGSLAGTLSGSGTGPTIFNPCRNAAGVIDASEGHYIVSYMASASGGITPGGGFSVPIAATVTISFTVTKPSPTCGTPPPPPDVGIIGGGGTMSGSISQTGAVTITTSWNFGGAHVGGSGSAQ